MQLVCRYGGDPSSPLEGVVVCDYPDSSAVTGDAVPEGCVVVRGQQAVDAKDPATGADVYPRVGPEPAKLGDPPTEARPDHDELDEADVPLTVRRVDAAGVARDRTHPLRAVAGQPYVDRRRVAVNDTRPRRAPSQGDPGVLEGYGSWRAETLALRGVVVGGVRYPADPAGLHTVEARASRSLRDAKFTVKVLSESGEVRQLSGQDLVDAADAVSDLATGLTGAVAGLAGAVSRGEVRTFTDVDALMGA